jgi:hypothetical protein
MSWLPVVVPDSTLPRRRQMAGRDPTPAPSFLSRCRGGEQTEHHQRRRRETHGYLPAEEGKNRTTRPHRNC